MSQPLDPNPRSIRRIAISLDDEELPGLFDGIGAFRIGSVSDLAELPAGSAPAVVLRMPVPALARRMAAGEAPDTALAGWCELAQVQLAALEQAPPDTVILARDALERAPVAALAPLCAAWNMTLPELPVMKEDETGAVAEILAAALLSGDAGAQELAARLALRCGEALPVPSDPARISCAQRELVRQRETAERMRMEAALARTGREAAARTRRTETQRTWLREMLLGAALLRDGGGRDVTVPLPRISAVEPISRPRLFIDVQHGLANRLRAMISAAVVAARTGRELVVIWRPDHHCAARIGDLLDYDGAVIEDDTGELCRRFAGRVYNYMEIEPGSVFQDPILPDEGPGEGREDVYIRSAYTLTSPHCDFDAEQSVLHSLVPATVVRELVGTVRRPNDVAMHIRVGTGPGFDHLSWESPDNWPEERHRELVEWRARSQAPAFMSRLDALIAEGRAESVFLAADLAQTYEAFAARYGSRIAMLRRDLYDRSPRQMQYALADMILLTAAPHFLASTWSSFSDIAQRLAAPGRVCEQSGQDF